MDRDGDQKSDLDHWVDANFLTILNGHVFNQIDPIYRQIPNREITQVQIQTTNTQWTGIIGTNGKLVSRMIISDLNNIEDPSIRKILEDRAAVKGKNCSNHLGFEIIF